MALMRLRAEVDGGVMMIAELKELARKWKSGSVDAGFFTQKNATVANILEFGAPAGRIPPRPFMRLTTVESASVWIELLRTHIEMGEDTKTALTAVGERMSLAIAGNVFAGSQFIANAENTIRKKGRDRPLWETGKLYSAVSYRVYIGKKYLGRGDE
jgi:hypothetical protein